MNMINRFESEVYLQIIVSLLYRDTIKIIVTNLKHNLLTLIL
jgi:hypothetical protein